MGRITRFVAGLALCITARFIPHPPNLEPIMATMMPFAKKMGAFAGFVFAFLSLASWDFVSGRLGMWTLYCAVTYGVIGVLAAKFFATRKATRGNFVVFAIGGTIFYDAVSAFLFGWQFGQPLWVTFVGQVPFTAMHLLGNVAFAAIASPLIYGYLAASESVAANVSKQPA
ncbi:Uncharacterised protein [Candidatus Norongarragalina meridionalis]|nr:Uncharacterised protein [Candidatus Norongarragalina meridionalis]